jgi:LmbE family N-acetylglucosaminyl deacetylase
MKSSIFTVLLFALIFIQCNKPIEKPAPVDYSSKTLLAIFAHPDDETTVSPVLAKYAAEGVNVYLAIATDGRLGVTEHAKIPAGDSLASVRAEEAKCAADKLGIHPPILFGLHDQLKMEEGYGPLHDQLNTMRTKINELFTSLSPDVVITWGASGWTGHHDHRLVGSIVTEVFESKHWDKPSQLYYAAIPTGNIPAGSPMQLATVDSSFLTVKVPVSDSDYAKAKESHLCHKSQYTSDVSEGMQQMIKASLKGIAYFQPLVISSSEKKDLF